MESSFFLILSICFIIQYNQECFQIEKWKSWKVSGQRSITRKAKLQEQRYMIKIEKFSLWESFEWDFHRRDYEIFASHNGSISIQWIEWIPGKHLVSPPFDSMRRTMGEIRSRKIQGSAFWKAWKIPENKGPRPSSSSSIEIRHAVGRGAMENDGRTVSLSKFDSCGSPFEDLEPIHAARTSGDTPETSCRKHLSSPPRRAENVISSHDKRNVQFLGNFPMRNRLMWNFQQDKN